MAPPPQSLSGGPAPEAPVIALFALSTFPLSQEYRSNKPKPKNS
jgi:hypothetical protein